MVMAQKRVWVDMDGCNGGHGVVKTVGGQGMQTDVLSTQSTSEPDVVKGMRESMATPRRCGVKGCSSVSGNLEV